MKNRKSKGFTILELVVTIAVMGIISTITIPIINGINDKNNHSNDQAFVKSLNNNLALEEVKNDTSKILFRDALSSLEEYGYTYNDLVSKRGDQILWNETNNRFVLASEKDNSIEDYHYWTIVDSYDENKQQYSMYAASTLETDTIDNLRVGFDVGNNLNIKNINYIRGEDLASQEVNLITSGGVNLKVNAPNDVIRHYGNGHIVDIEHIKNDSFHEYGEFEELKIQKGRYILERTGFVKEVTILDDDAIFATTLKKKLPNILVYGTKIVHLQIVSHDVGKVLLDTYAYINKDHHFMLNNVSTKEEIALDYTGYEDDAYSEDEAVISNPETIAELKNQDIEITKLSEGEIITLYLEEKMNFNASLSGYINEYPVTGSFILTSDVFKDISYQAIFTIKASEGDIDVEFTKSGSTYYLVVNNRAYVFENGNLKSLVEMFNASMSGLIVLPDDYLSLTQAYIRRKLNNMTAVINNNEITYTCSLLDDTAPLIIKSDDKFNLKSISLSNLEEDGYTYSLNMNVNSLGSTLININPAVRDYLAININNMDSTTKDAIVNQLHTMTSTHTAGFNYDIEVNRDNKLTFTTEGKLDVSVQEDNGEKDISLALNGNMVNAGSDLPLNSKYSISYLNENIYFSYQNRLKLSYERVGFENLVNIIKNHLETNNDFKEFSQRFMPDNSTKDAPIFDILFSTQNFKQLFNYYEGLDIKNSKLIIDVSPSLLNATGNNIKVTISKDGKGIDKIELNNLYVYGYTINGTLSIKDYESINVGNVNSYTKMDYINNSFDKLFSLFQQKELGLTLTGNVFNLKDNSTTTFTGCSQFKLTDSKNTGYGNIVIHDKDNKTHNITLDVTKTNVSKNASEQEQNAAFASSKVLFNYNNNLKGYFSVGSILDVYSLIENLASSNDSRFEKYKNLLLADISRSTIARLLKDEVESILYNDMITNITYSNNKYTIELNGNFMKNNDVYQCESIFIDVRIDNNRNLKGITVRSDKMMDYRFNVSLDLTSYNPSLKGLTQDSSYKDFSDLRTLAEYLLNTGKRNDFHASGSLTIDLDLISIIHPNVEDVPLDAYVHIEKDENGDEKVYSRVEMEVPYWSSLIQNSKEWKDRKFYIYFTDTEVYLRTKTRTDSKNFEKKEVTCKEIKEEKTGLFGIKYTVTKYQWDGKTTSWKEQYYTCQDMKLTMDEFFSDSLYYIFNFGFDLKQNLTSYSGTNDNMDYSKIIKNYQYSNNGQSPTWNVSLDMQELTTKSNFSDLAIYLAGDTNSKEMKSITASLDVKIIYIINIGINLNATLDNTVISAARLNDIKNYINYNKNHTNKTNYTSTYTYIASSSRTNDGTGTTSTKIAPTALLLHKTVSSFTPQPTQGSYQSVSPSGYYVTRT